MPAHARLPSQVDGCGTAGGYRVIAGEGVGLHWWSRQDVVSLARLPVGFALAWLAPEQRWEVIGQAIASRRAHKRAAWVAGEAAWIRRIAGDRLDEPAARSAVIELIGAFRIRQLQFMRALRPGSWSPPVRLEGREHADRAITSGKGVILWASPFVFSALMTKVTCARLGLPIMHLSRWLHGTARSRLGMPILNGYQQRAENRFLEERVVIGKGDAGVAATRRLATRLKANGIVTITVAAEGSGRVELPFLDGRLRLANGAIKLARQTGAALIPTTTIRHADGCFVTVLDAPIAVGAGAGGMQEAALQMAGILERTVLQTPGQFFWRDGIVAAAED